MNQIKKCDMDLVSKIEILEHLESEGANESELCEVCGTDTVYFMVYPNTMTDFDFDFDNIGRVIIKCKEGFIQMPILEYYNGNGFEQFDLDKVETISKEEVKKYYDTFMRTAKFINEMLED